jgi:ethanolamine transporter EutH
MTRLVTQPYHYLVHEPMAPYDTLNGLAALVAILAVPVVWWRLGTAYALFMLANLALPLSSGQYEGLGRYTTVLFPIPILLGTIEQPASRMLALGLGAAFYTLCLALFVNVHPIF